SSPTDIEPVLRAVAQSAARLCDATDVVIRRVDGEIARAAVHIGPIPLPPQATAPRISDDWVGGSALIQRRTLHVAAKQTADGRWAWSDPETGAASWPLLVPSGAQRLLAVPMVREERAIG